jgi:uncharacterized protein (DUF2147 family)
VTRTLSALALALVLALPLAARAGDPQSPVGRWITVDDNNGKDRSWVLIEEKDGVLTGRIERLIVDPGEDPAPKCDKCKGDRKDQPVTGMVILWDLKKDGDEWSGGRILDPENGKDYKCFIKVENGGARLKVGGFIGFALLGRTQYWKRAAEAPPPAPAPAP